MFDFENKWRSVSFSMSVSADVDLLDIVTTSTPRTLRPVIVYFCVSRCRLPLVSSISHSQNTPDSHTSQSCVFKDAHPDPSLFLVFTIVSFSIYMIVSPIFSSSFHSHKYGSSHSFHFCVCRCTILIFFQNTLDAHS